MDELYDFLRSRNVSDENIKQLEKDKVVGLLKELCQLYLSDELKLFSRIYIHCRPMIWQEKICNIFVFSYIYY